MRTIAKSVGLIVLIGLVVWLGLSAIFGWEPVADDNDTASAQADDPSTPAPTGTTPSGTGTAVATGGSSTPAPSNFNPVKSYEQSCAPEHRNGCSWDIGTMGTHVDILNREVVEVGIVKGFSISWEGNTAPNGNGRCSLVVLTPGEWFENLHVIDANVTLYKVTTADVAGWVKTLAVQAAFEQQANYGCPEKSLEEISLWGSPIASPPCGTPGFPACSTTAQPGSTVDPNSCETVNCKDRRLSAESNGEASFTAGEAVYGFTITVGGTVYRDCYLENTSASGTVVDGVVNPWKTEVENRKVCTAT